MASPAQKLSVAGVTLSAFPWLASCDVEKAPSNIDSQRNDSAWFAAPGAERGSVCADLLDVAHVCWLAGKSPDCPSGICVERRALPEFPAASQMGFRCAGAGAGRRCVDRQAGVGRFLCDGNRCRQRHPRLPDDGEWTCADAAGAAVCVGGEAPAGVVPGAADSGWFCGRRRGARTERVCIDLSPDFPDAAADGFRCYYEHEPTIVRICERRRSGPLLAGLCRGNTDCAAGARCVAGRCVIDSPKPECWLDSDCGSTTCRFAHCLDGASP